MVQSSAKMPEATLTALNPRPVAKGQAERPDGDPFAQALDSEIQARSSTATERGESKATAQAASSQGGAAAADRQAKSNAPAADEKPKGGGGVTGTTPGTRTDTGEEAESATLEGGIAEGENGTDLPPGGALVAAPLLGAERPEQADISTAGGDGGTGEAADETAAAEASGPAPVAGLPMAEGELPPPSQAQAGVSTPPKMEPAAQPAPAGDEVQVTVQDGAKPTRVQAGSEMATTTAPLTPERGNRVAEGRGVAAGDPLGSAPREPDAPPNHGGGERQSQGNGAAMGRAAFASLYHTMRRLEGDGQPPRFSMEASSLSGAASPTAPSGLLGTPLPAPANLPSAFTLAIPLAQKGWDQALGERVVWMSREGMQEATIQLNPRHLGPIEVRVSLHQEQASVHFTAQHAETRQALEGALPRLRELMQEQGLNLVQSEVSQQSPQQQGMDGRGGGSGVGGAHGGGDGGTEEETVVTTTTSVSRSGVDFYA